MSIWDTYKGSTANPVNLFAREDPRKGANKYLDQIPGATGQYYNPFIQGGQTAGNKLGGEYDKMLDPSSFMDHIIEKYQMSKGAEYQRDKLGKGIGATAAAGGYAGTPEHQTEYGEMANGIMSKDMQEYLQNALQIYGGGIAGEKDFYDKGFDASKSMADIVGGKLGSQAGLSFQADSQTNASRDAFMNALMKALAQGAGGMG